MASHRAIISADEAKIQFLENGNGWLVQKLRTSEEQEAHLASILPEAHAENDQLTFRLGRTEETLAQVEARERRGIENSEARYMALQRDASGLRGEIWDATNESGMAEAEMNVMTEQTAALKAKYKGVEDRRTRLAILEDANKGLREKMDVVNKAKRENDGVVHELSAENNKLKKRLAEVGKVGTALDKAKMVAQAFENENAELREELIEVTTVLEQVGNSPAVPANIAQLAESLEGSPPLVLDSIHQQTRAPTLNPVLPAQRDEVLPGGTKVHHAQQAQVLTPADKGLVMSPPPLQESIAQVARTSSASNVGKASERGGGGSLSPRAPGVSMPGAAGKSPDARLSAALSNVTRALSPGTSPERYVAPPRGASTRSVSPYAAQQQRRGVPGMFR